MAAIPREAAQRVTISPIERSPPRCSRTISIEGLLDQRHRLSRQNPLEIAEDLVIEVFNRQVTDQRHKKEKEGKKGEERKISKLGGHGKDIVFVELFPDVGRKLSEGKVPERPPAESFPPGGPVLIVSFGFQIKS
ncbi:MAG: hypothetical protein MPW16_08750 [Candidatus Manganitrophus sp.]|nr:MAG: hypothetical protein MPW16_08750 [Candidatus Manganitrophus sp.]